MRTSHTHPLRIADIATGSDRGKIGITFAPGKKQLAGMSGPWDRDLATDLDSIAAWNAAAVVTLLENHELDELKIAGLGQEVRRRHMEWHHWPIKDGGVPSSTFQSMWGANSARARSLLQTGANVLVHCKGGQGRAGMVAARLLAEVGIPPEESIRTVRAAREGAIETSQQEKWAKAGHTSEPPEPDRDIGAIRDLVRRRNCAPSFRQRRVLHRPCAPC
jgi:ADP-ribosyl-[dinitrogen reductase] hydrolase